MLYIMKPLTIGRALLATCLLVLYACNLRHSPHPVLLQAEQLMDQRPDSALMLLTDSIDSSALSGKNHADWCLLITQARDMDNIKHTSDSLIQMAYEYYEAHPDPERLMLACFYMGKVNQALGDAPQAQEYYLKALSAGKTSDNVKLKAKLCSYIGILYTYQHAYQIALPYMQESLHYLSLAGDTLSQAIVFRDIARTYHKLKQVDSTEIYYRKAADINYHRERPYILNELGGCLMDQKKYDEALPYLQTAIQTVERPSTSFYLTIGELFYRTGNKDSARYYLQQGILGDRLSPKANSYYYLAQLAFQDKKYEEFRLLQNQYENLRDSLEQLTNTEVMFQMQGMYNYSRYREIADKQHLEQAVYERNLYKAILVGIFIFACLVASVFIALRLKKKKDEQTCRAQMLNDTLVQKEEELSVIKKTRATLEHEFHVSDVYCKFVNGKGTYDKKEREAFYAALNEAYPNFIGGIRKYLPDLHGEDEFIVYMTKIKLSKNLIASYLRLKPSAITNRRSSLAQRIFGEKDRIRDLDGFIQSDGNQMGNR